MICEICGKPFEREFGGGNLTEGGMAFKCPECSAKGLDSSPRAGDVRARGSAEFVAELKQIAPGTPVITWGLVGVCTVVFVLELAKGAGFDSMTTALAIQLGADYGPLTLTGQWWRMLTSMFLHFGIIHLGFNMLCLFALGSLAERLMGRAGFLVLYFASGLAGSLLSLAISPGVVSAGASGAIFGVVGGMVTYLWLKKAPIDFAKAKKELQSLGIFIAYNVLYGLRPGVDIMAHAGGLIAGLAIGAILPRYLETVAPTAVLSPIHEGGQTSKRVVVVGAVCAIALIIGSVAVRRLQADTVYAIGSLDQIDAGHSADVIPMLQQIVDHQPDLAMAHFALGAAYLRTGRENYAVDELQRAVLLKPGNRAFKDELDQAYKMLAETSKPGGK
jgi:rhomboid protease GluP